ncbi:DoxX family protein [Williamsia sterculiae]|uniref:Putative oxidoreductase n=1 Tax=Williamsia sterculiae TaxID=1344003 RepID=A0A1N7F2G0_9NOCA|nr:DoxX family protein [Williamsia sterculiae]SIR94517.1 putative oxidoreductase [Williamsia sterculiae]
MGISRNFASFVARVLLGIIFIAHGWQKFHTMKISGTTSFFDSVGIPFPKAAAYYATWVELAGGVLLILGVLVPLVSILLIADMIGAIAYVHADKGFWNSDGGWEWPAALIAGLLAVGLAGTGRIGGDHYLTGRFRRS